MRVLDDGLGLFGRAGHNLRAEPDGLREGHQIGLLRGRGGHDDMPFACERRPELTALLPARLACH